MFIQRLVIVGALLLTQGSSQALAQTSDLVLQINQYRGQPEACDGAPSTPMSALQPHPRLQQLALSGRQDLQQQLTDVGYRPQVLQVMRVQGSRDVNAVFNRLKSQFCEVLLDPQYVDIAVRQAGDEWQIVVARPLLDPALPAWQEAGQTVLRLTNQVRQAGRYCGDEYFPPVAAVQWHPKLAQAALAHSEDMATQDYFSHDSLQGTSASERVSMAAYSWQSVGENLAAGSGSAADAVQGWLDSPGHCANLMNAEFTQMGAAYATDAQSSAYIYWTQKFARPR